ncbi:dapper homolog 3-like [Poecile atricapillus]|uniref:dapper homolog 3-like n=1 Tax=Poecile atricapillus TaxID=48891 RepID=UPI00273A2F23|nr:dapper homolog 3-like [Poecile atricapillus]
MTDLSPSLLLPLGCCACFTAPSGAGTAAAREPLGGAGGAERRWPGSAPGSAPGSPLAPARRSRTRGSGRSSGDGGERRERGRHGASTQATPGPGVTERAPQAPGEPDPTNAPQRGSLPSGEICSRGKTPSAADPALTPGRPAALRSPPARHPQPGTSTAARSK